MSARSLAHQPKRRTLLTALRFIGSRLLRVQRHVVFVAGNNAPAVPPRRPGERCWTVVGGTPLEQDLRDQLLSLSPGNAEYLVALARREADVCLIAKDGRLVHYAFLLHANRTTRLLGFGRDWGLIGNMFTCESQRNKGYQGCSAAALAALARASGMLGAIAETSYDNTASQHGLKKGGMCYYGKIELVIVLNVLAIRFRRPDAGLPLAGFCW